MEYQQNPPHGRLVEDIYNGSSIFLCASLSEGWGLPPAEAMSCGCAAVSTDNGGVRDYAIHGETALLSPPEDPQVLADNLNRVLNDGTLRTKLARQGNEYIQEFNWNRAVQAMADFIG